MTLEIQERTAGPHKNHFCGKDSNCLFAELPKLPAPARRIDMTSSSLKET